MSSHPLSVTHQSLREGQPQVRRVAPSSGETTDSEDMQKCLYRHNAAQVRVPRSAKGRLLWLLHGIVVAQSHHREAGAVL